MLQTIPRRVRKVREKIRHLDREVALFALGGLIEELLEEYVPFPKVVQFVKELQQDIADHVELFTQPSPGEAKETAELSALEHAIDRDSIVGRCCFTHGMHFSVLARSDRPVLAAWQRWRAMSRVFRAAPALSRAPM